MKKTILIIQVISSMLLYSCSKNSIEQQIKIGTQLWRTTNLNVTSFRNGDAIPEAKTTSEWTAAWYASKPAWRYYNYEPANDDSCGKLYNWYAVVDPRGLAPVGWHVPTDEEWATLETYLGGSSVAGSKMKGNSFFISTWEPTDTTADNSSGWTGLPCGFCYPNGYIGPESSGEWWSSTEDNEINAWSRGLSPFNAELSRLSMEKGFGFSVRCLRD